nr:immunoglobulin light chain junction region [Macaca mulatta]MOX11486.1 immunoglobulin light chain junction region [Macaca mulatta]MOX11514.1 immunoglobulin light chain junction region [Macaca mulatta]MOX11543.1 immunoglobulin light chain junction region [Macaca mulatta]MOX11728.1 immunoglobulin light chain junction region [Macaca mulatta]
DYYCQTWTTGFGFF